MMPDLAEITFCAYNDPPAKARARAAVNRIFTSVYRILLNGLTQEREFQFQRRSRMISRAQLYPAAPITPPPGCAPDPHRYKPRSGVRYLAQPATGRITNI